MTKSLKQYQPERHGLKLIGARGLVAGLLVAAAAGSAEAMPVFDVDPITRPNTMVITFQEVKEKLNKSFGSPDVGQPYAKLGLVLPSQVIATVPELRVPGKEAVVVRSTGMSTVDNANYQSISFASPQKNVGFSVKDVLATSIVITAMDAQGNVVETVNLGPSKDARFVGFKREQPDIVLIRVVAAHATIGDAINSPTFIGDITFAAPFDSGAEGDDQTKLGLSPSDVGLGSSVSLAVGTVGPAGGAYINYGGDATGGSQSSGNLNNNSAPGNRNPNAPPTIIPEPAMVSAAGALVAGLIGQRRRRV
jgi:hypothetical protein